MSRLLFRLRLYSNATTATTSTPISIPTPPSYSTSSTAISAATHFLARTASSPPQTRTQTLDLNQLNLLRATLSRPPLPTTSTTTMPSIPSPDNSSSALAIPPTHHLIYFTSPQPPPPSALLGPDGTDTSYSPAAPFTRRMWAGGELRWAVGSQNENEKKGKGRGKEEKGGQKNLLRVGQQVTERTEVKSAVAKRTRAGGEMVVVGVEKTLANEEGWAVVDTRNWIFRPQITIPSSPTPRPTSVPFPTGRYTRDLVMTPVTLFRFSALTFNGHKIHYDREWCRAVEGHRELVVHGPLNLVHMVDFWRDVMGGGDDEMVPERVVYRATSPLYAGEPYRIVMDEEREGVSEVRIVDGYGNISMVGSIERFQESK